MRLMLVAVLLAFSAAPGSAQVDGHVSVMFDVLPDVDPVEGRQTVSELRTRVFAERRDEIGEHVRVNVAGYVDALLADRSAIGATGTARDATLRPTDLYIEFAASRFDLRAGASRLVWGRLDEFQPTDVVNPIDLTRFILEGRGEARLPVGMVRGRLFLPGASTLEAVLVPAFRASRFDQLDEETSPFNLVRVRVPVRRDKPAFGRDSLQGGGRFTSTFRRVDWGVSAYRGFRTFPILSFPPTAFAMPTVLESFPRFTMIGGDFEAVRGVWAVRGEVALFPRDELQSTRAVRGVPARGVEGGVGVDRRAGDYRIAANVLWSLRRVDTSSSVGQAFDGDDELERSDVSLVVAADRSFARETRTLRVLTVYDPGDATVFSRLIAAVSLRDNVWVEASGGIFAGAALDTIGRLTNRDFGYVRLKVFF